jgi:hypothetical protein
MFGLQEVDALIQEMLLSRDDTDPIFRLNSPTSTAPPRQEIIDLPPTAPQQHQPDSQGQRHSFLVMSETNVTEQLLFFNRFMILQSFKRVSGFFVTGQSQPISVQHDLEPPPAKMTKVEIIE